MDVEKAASIFVGTILLGFTFITTAGVIVLINNIFARWWKPVHWISYTWAAHPAYQEPVQPTESTKPN